MGSPKTDIAFFKEIEQMERRLFNKFVLHNRIGHGSFGELYCGEDLQTHEKVAIKMEHYQTRPPQLYYEMKIYRVLNGGVGIPCLKWYGVQDQYNVMVIDLLDVSLEELFRKCSFRFSLKTVLMLADQMLERIQFIHCRGVIHRDVKPDNFVLGMGDNANLLYMIDFGLARSYRDSRTGEHIPYRDSRALTGTARYASVNVHAGIEPSRRDDLESLAYVLIYFMRGDLPWQSVRIDSESARLRVIGDVKERMAADKLCAGMPDEFLWFLNEVRSLEFCGRAEVFPLQKQIPRIVHQIWICLRLPVRLGNDRNRRAKIPVWKPRRSWKARTVHATAYVDQNTYSVCEMVWKRENACEAEGKAS